ncbi:helix-turn-helix domain-containing protein [Ruminococcaceae bacterium OttesenSCG-928-D13]|nr:helix-turn-helix domain-containing protein [Ruminococcaceae bacterium OttesenSCG-928-D13]
MEKMGKWYKHYRERVGLTQVAIAEKANISLQTYQKYESGERKPKRERAEMLAEIFGVSSYHMYSSPIIDYQETLYRYARLAVLGDSSVEMYWDDYNDGEVFRDLDVILGKWQERIQEKYPRLFEQYIKNPTFVALRDLMKKMRKYELVQNLNLCDECCDPEKDEVIEDIQVITILKLPILMKERNKPKRSFDDIDLNDFVPIENAIELSEKKYRVAGFPVDLYQVLQAAFCIAFVKYTASQSLSSILEEIVEEIPLDWLDDEGYENVESIAIKYFGVELFTPYASLMGDVFELIDTFGTMADFERIYFYQDSSLKYKTLDV